VRLRNFYDYDSRLELRDEFRVVRWQFRFKWNDGNFQTDKPLYVYTNISKFKSDVHRRRQSWSRMERRIGGLEAHGVFLSNGNVDFWNFKSWWFNFTNSLKSKMLFLSLSLGKEESLQQNHLHGSSCGCLSSVWATWIGCQYFLFPWTGCQSVAGSYRVSPGTHSHVGGVRKMEWMDFPKLQIQTHTAPLDDAAHLMPNTRRFLSEIPPDTWPSYLCGLLPRPKAANRNRCLSACSK
jgi:hypothetical protein